MGTLSFFSITKGQNWPTLKCLQSKRRTTPRQWALFSENLDQVCEPRQGNRPANPGILEKKFIENGYFEHFQEGEKRGREEKSSSKSERLSLRATRQSWLAHQIKPTDPCHYVIT